MDSDSEEHTVSAYDPRLSSPAGQLAVVQALVASQRHVKP